MASCYLVRHGAPYDQPNLVSGIQPVISARVNKNSVMVAILENPEAFLSEQLQEKPTHRL